MSLVFLAVLMNLGYSQNFLLQTEITSPDFESQWINFSTSNGGGGYGIYGGIYGCLSTFCETASCSGACTAGGWGSGYFEQNISNNILLPYYPDSTYMAYWNITVAHCAGGAGSRECRLEMLAYNTSNHSAGNEISLMNLTTSSSSSSIVYTGNFTIPQNTSLINVKLHVRYTTGYCGNPPACSNEFKVNKICLSNVSATWEDGHCSEFTNTAPNLTTVTILPAPTRSDAPELTCNWTATDAENDPVTVLAYKWWKNNQTNVSTDEHGGWTLLQNETVTSFFFSLGDNFTCEVTPQDTYPMMWGIGEPMNSSTITISAPPVPTVSGGGASDVVSSSELSLMLGDRNLFELIEQLIIIFNVSSEFKIIPIYNHPVFGEIPRPIQIFGTYTCFNYLVISQVNIDIPIKVEFDPSQKRVTGAWGHNEQPFPDIFLLEAGSETPIEICVDARKEEVGGLTYVRGDIIFTAPVSIKTLQINGDPPIFDVRVGWFSIGEWLLIGIVAVITIASVIVYRNLKKKEHVGGRKGLLISRVR